MNDSNTEKASLPVLAHSKSNPFAAVVNTTETSDSKKSDNVQNLGRTSSSPNGSNPKSPQKTKNNGNNDEESTSPDKLVGRERLQPLIKRQSIDDKNSVKGSNQERSVANESDSDSGSDDSPVKSRNPFNDVDSPLYGSKREKSQSIVETEHSTEFEAMQRTYTEVLGKPFNHSSSVLLSRTSEASKSVLMNTSLKYIDKTQWTDELKCYVCARVFNKMDRVFTHHCRACGKSVCGDCSTKKINDNRACDVCFYKVTNAHMEERRQNLLKEKTRLIKEYQRKAEEAQKQLEELTEKKKELEKQIYQEREDQDKAFLTLQKEKLKVQENLEKKRNNNRKLKETLQVEQAALKKKEDATNEIKEVLNTIKLDLAEKKGNITSKQEEAERLAGKREFYEKSFLSCIDVKDGESFVRSASVAESCDPNIPGRDNNNNNQVENESMDQSPKDNKYDNDGSNDGSSDGSSNNAYDDDNELRVEEN